MRGSGGAQRLVKGRRARLRDANRVLGGAHPKHVVHAEVIRARLCIRDAGHIETQRLVERHIVVEHVAHACDTGRVEG